MRNNAHRYLKKPIVFTTLHVFLRTTPWAQRNLLLQEYRRCLQTSSLNSRANVYSLNSDKPLQLFFRIVFSTSRDELPNICLPPRDCQHNMEKRQMESGILHSYVYATPQPLQPSLKDMFPVKPIYLLQITSAGNSKFCELDRSLPRRSPRDGTTATTTSKSPAAQKAVETKNVAL